MALITRLGLGLGAGALFIFAVIAAVMPSGLARIDAWWLTSVAFGLGLIAATATGAWRMAGLVGATFMAGFGAQLAIKEPSWFQEIHFHATSAFWPILLAAIGVQAATAAYALVHSRALKSIARTISELGWARVLFVVAGVCAGVAGCLGFAGSGHYGAFAKQVAAASAFAGLNALSIIALAASAPAGELKALSAWAQRRIGLPGADAAGAFDAAFPLWVAAFVAVFTAIMRIVVFENLPHIDEVKYLFQAQYFAQGQIAYPAPPSWDAFQVDMVLSRDGKLFSGFPPGWPAMLAVGVRLGAVWLVNPLLAGACILLLHAFVTATTDRGMANLAIVLAAVSPWFLWTSSTLMPHTFTFVLMLGAWNLLLIAKRKGATLAALVAGCLLGLHFLTRPLEGLAVGVLTGLWTLTFLSARGGWKYVIAYGLGCAAIGALIFPYNAALVGDALHTPLNTFFDDAWHKGANRLGFGADIGPPDWGGLDPFAGHSPLEALLQAQHMYYVLNFELLGWGMASTAFALMFMVWGKWTKLAAAMAVLSATIVLLHGFYWFAAGFYAGPRYWSIVLLPLIILTALGVRTLAERLAQIVPDAQIGARLGAGVATLCLCTLLVFSGWQAFNKYPGYRGGHGDYRDLARQDGFDNSIVFVTTNSRSEFDSAFWLNDFSPGSTRTLFAHDLGVDANLATASAYPERRFYFAQGRGKSGARVTLTSGPLTLEELRAKQ